MLILNTVLFKDEYDVYTYTEVIINIKYYIILRLDF
ncbi:hypothetical protein Clocel_2324 [Clostridium cellulovorans 743B]|uniref:Uncharacterized protein n=1 Tax=Clostridium cellulovorans (strain ATCC 35296 / DSM 3052 / OCM 3 / 743B) TaxID=573061 RepID=D9SP78_CLOC7|nr:hypothetical protein Clocel_2324 [Clostridium cellulovorans 743B]